MNIDDATTTNCPDNVYRALCAMFDRQRELMAKYCGIEKRNGGNVPADPISLQDAKRQWRIKEDFWRTTEEIAEAWEELHLVGNEINSWRTHWGSNPKVRHIFEELADAFHFLIEATLHSGHDVDSLDLKALYEDYGNHEVNLMAEAQMNDFATDARNNSHLFIEAMGIAANELKNKPWKQTQMETDTERFRSRLRNVWAEWFSVWTALDADYRDFFDLYFKKSEVNKFRQRSQY